MPGNLYPLPANRLPKLLSFENATWQNEQLTLKRLANTGLAEVGGASHSIKKIIVKMTKKMPRSCQEAAWKDVCESQILTANEKRNLSWKVSLQSFLSMGCVGVNPFYSERHQ